MFFSGEIYRALKPGGHAILQVPYSETIGVTSETADINDPALQSTLYGQKDHVRIYLLTDYIERLKNAGFNVQVIDYKELHDYYINAIQPGESFLKTK